MSFRYSGTNWEGRAWFCPVSIVKLGMAFTAVPDRPTTIDGTVASKPHDQANPTSDHRPHPYTGKGIVRGLDATVTVGQGAAIFAAMNETRDPRVKYVIHDGRFFSSYPTSTRKAWQIVPYNGPNPHRTHIHTSTLESGDNGGHDWQLTTLEKDLMTVSAWAQASWDKAKSEGIITEDSIPKATVTVEQLMVFLNRAGAFDQVGNVVGVSETVVKQMIEGSKIVVP